MVRSDIFNEICGKSSLMEIPLTLPSFLVAVLTLICNEVIGHAPRLAFSFDQGARSSWAPVALAGVESTDLDSNAPAWTDAAACGMHISLVGHTTWSPRGDAIGQQSRTGMESSGAVWTPVESGGLPWIGVDAGGICPTPNGQKWPREVASRCLLLPSTPPFTSCASGNGRHRMDAHRHAQETSTSTPSPTPTDTGCHETPVPIDDLQLSATDKKSGRKMVKPAIAVSTTKQHNENQQ